jgi:isopenicillin N synthase-like dioxygenase
MTDHPVTDRPVTKHLAGTDQFNHSEIPVIDFSQSNGSAAERAAMAHDLQQICHDIGFFVIANHGVDLSVTEKAFAYSRQFFSFPLERKKLIDKTMSPHFRGWEAVGTEFTNNRKDYREQIDLWSEHPVSSAQGKPIYHHLLGPNQWLPEEVLPGFRTLMQQHTQAMETLGNQLMELFALGLGLPEDYFHEVFQKQPMSLTKIIHYPETPAGEFGVNAHHDTGFLTILNPGETPGLEIELADGSWKQVPIIKNTFIINLGEMLQAMTGNYFIATPHRVNTAEERYSIAYFHGPSLDTPLHRLPISATYSDAVAASPRHTNAGFMAPIKETEAGVADMQGTLQASTYGEQLWNYFSRSYPDNVKRFYPSVVV